jgi:hypothetical protein
MTTSTVKQLKAQMTKLKSNIRFAKQAEIFLKGFKQKEKYTFKTLASDDCTLFPEQLYDFSGLAINMSKVKHFEELYFICYETALPKELSSMVASCKYVLRHIDKNGNDEIMDSLIDELINK